MISFIVANLFVLICSQGISVGEEWRDTKGNVIQAHGGGFLEKDGWYYWVGENKAQNNSRFLGVSLYVSQDLVNWVYVKELLTLQSKWKNGKGICQVGKKTDNSYCTIERPKFMYNAKTDRFVIWAHWENGDDYGASHLLVAQSENGDPESEYTVISNSRPGVGHVATCLEDSTYDPAEYKEGGNDASTPGVPYVDGSKQIPATCYTYTHGETETENHYPWGYGSRDFTVFQDPDTNEGYLISAQDHVTMRAYTLSEDYLTADWQQSYPFAQGNAREAPALVKSDGVYFMLTSAQSGWYPNQGKYQTTTNLQMPKSVADAAALGVQWDGDPEHWADATWTPMTVIGSCTTFNSQPAGIITLMDRTDPNRPVPQFVYLGDRWVSDALGTSTYVWLPLTLDTKARTARLDFVTGWSVSDTGRITHSDLELLSKGKKAVGTNLRSQANCNADTCGPEGALDGEWTVSDNYADKMEPMFRPVGSPYNFTLDLEETVSVERIDIQYWIIGGSEGFVYSTVNAGVDGEFWKEVGNSNDDPQLGFRSYKVTGSNKFRYVQIQVTRVQALYNHNQEVSAWGHGLVEIAVWGKK